MFIKSLKNYVIVIAVVLLCIVLLASCGDGVVRDDSYDREQIQNCLNEGGTPIYEKTFQGYQDTIVIDFIACKK